MAKKTIVIVMVLLLIAVIQTTAFADSQRVLKSAIFPGMGQLGDDQRLRGLGYMTGEVLLLSMLFSEFSHVQSSSRETYVLTVRYDMAQTYEEKNRQYHNWQDAYNKYGDSQIKMIAYIGAAGLLWGWNIADAVLFAPKKSSEESLLEKTFRENLAFSGSLDRPEITLLIPF
jgi:hypothetical protein